MSLLTKYNRVSSAWRNDKYIVTTKLARDFLEEYPEFPYVWLMYGRALYSLARYTEARKAIQKAILLLPDDKVHIGYVQMGRLYSHKESSRIAERWYRRAVSNYPNTNNLVFLGTSLHQQGRLLDAKRCYRRAVRLATDPPDEAYYNLGIAYRSEGKYGKAIKYFEMAIEIDPKYRIAKNALKDLQDYKKLMKKPTRQSKGRPR